MKDTLTAIHMVMADIQKKYGSRAIQWAGDLPDIQYLSSGIEEIDAILQGGLPKGRIVEIFGLKQSGKTALACQLVSQCETVLFIDAERKMTKELITILHLPPQTVIVRPESLEFAFETIRDFLNLGVQAVIIDSLPALPPAKEVDGDDFTKITGVSQTAGMLSRKLPVLLALLDEQQSVLIVVNQQRANINAPAFGEQYHTFGGLALANYASVRLATARKAWQKHPKLGIFGMELAILVDKTNTSIPRQGTSVPLVYGVGIIPNAQLAMARGNLLTAGKRLSLPEPEDEIREAIIGHPIEGG